jgi:hypothetical protein
MMDQAIEKVKCKLIDKAKRRGLYENFGVDEIRELREKYGYTDEIAMLSNWAMNFDLSRLKATTSTHKILEG